MSRLAALLLLAAASAAAKEPARLRVLTINIAGIPLVHPRIGARIAGLGTALREGGYDLIALQEAWRESDVSRLAKASGLPYVARPESAFPVASGLAILSRWPIVATEQRTFSALRPSLVNVTQGEPFSPKGMIMARVATPWGELDVYDSHTISDYPSTTYEALRLTQLFELSEFALERSRHRPFVLLGDLNTGPGKRDFELFMDALGARDLCRGGGLELCGDPRRDGPRIDHILVPPGALDARALRALEEPVPGLSPPTSYSDHIGFSADLPPSLFKLKPRPDSKRRAAALRKIAAVFARMIARLDSPAFARGWIPFYGAPASARYARQARILDVLRRRAFSALGPDSVGGDDARIGHQVVPAAALQLPERP